MPFYKPNKRLYNYNYKNCIFICIVFIFCVSIPYRFNYKVPLHVNPLVEENVSIPYRFNYKY